MNKLRLIAAVVIAGAFTLLSTGAAQAYPDGPNVSIAVPNSTLIGGKIVHFTITTDTPGLNCDWTVKFPNGVASGVNDTITGSGTSFAGSYKTKVVSGTQKHVLSATCSYSDTQTSSAPASAQSNTVTPAIYVANSGSTVQAATQTASASAVITLLPLGSGTSGALPNTGGSHLWVLVLAGALLVAGGGVVVASRRRSTH